MERRYNAYIKNELYRAYAYQLVRLELKSISSQRIVPSIHQSIFEYVTSTKNRRSYGLLCVLAAMEKEPISPSDIAKLLGVSRNSVDTMISETKSHGWIVCSRSKRGIRSIEAAPIMIDCWVDYAEWVSKNVQDIGLSNVEAAVKMIGMATK